MTLLAFAGAFAVANWVSRATATRWLEYVTKPTVTLLLLALALTLEPSSPAQRMWFAAAVLLSLGGDGALMLPRERFVPGLASFLLAHLAYIAGFVVAGVDIAWLGAGAVAIALVTIPIGTRIVGALRRDGPSSLAGPVMAYMAVIGLMVATAVGHGNTLAIAGAALFMVSDSLIAWNKFVRPLVWAPVGIMVTYHAAQAGLVLSLMG